MASSEHTSLVNPLRVIPYRINGFPKDSRKDRMQ